MKKVISIILSLSLLFSLAVPTFAASPVPAININDIQSEMENFLQEAHLPMEVENFSISLRDDVDLNKYTADEISNLLREDLNHLKAIMSSGQTSLTVHPQPRLANLGGGKYTAEIWAGVPSIGWTTIKHDFRASISGGKVSSVTFIGNSYMDGVSWGRYTPNYSWYECYSNNTKVDIYIKGTINYLFDLIGADYTATFVEELQVSGNILERQW